MRSPILLVVLAACSSSNPVTPRLIPGGGVGDGAIDGTVNVYAIDSETEAPLVGATVSVGCATGTTDAKGFAQFKDVIGGPQEIAAKADGYRPTVWVGVDGVNVTIPVTASPPMPPQATLSGTITDWDTVTVAAQHVKAGVVFYSQTATIGDAQNSLQTPAMGNICVTPAACNWSVVSRAGTVTLAAAIVDRDTKGTTDTSDDTETVIGWASLQDVVVADGVAQTGLALAMAQAGDLQTVTIDLGTPPAALTQTQSEVGIELGPDEVMQLPVFQTATMSMLVPAPSMMGATTYRLTAVAQAPSTTLAAQSAIIVPGVTGTSLTAGTWLVPPTGVTVTRRGATFDRVAGAKLHQVSWTDGTGAVLLDMTLFDPTASAMDVPDWLGLPVMGTLTAQVSGIAADIDLGNFSLDADRDKLLGIAAQPVNVP